MYLISSVPLISLQPKKVCWFTVHNKPTTTKRAYTDSSTLWLTLSLGTQWRGGGDILPLKVTNVLSGWISNFKVTVDCSESFFASSYQLSSNSPWLLHVDVSPDATPRGWLGSKHHLTNSHVDVIMLQVSSFHPALAKKNNFVIFFGQANESLPLSPSPPSLTAHFLSLSHSPFISHFTVWQTKDSSQLCSNVDDGLNKRITSFAVVWNTFLIGNAVTKFAWYKHIVNCVIC